MADFLDLLAQNARETINSGYYEVATQTVAVPGSLKKAIFQCKHAPVITEVKVASPSLGVIKRDIDIEGVAAAMERGGAVGISVLTEPKYFKGSLFSLSRARRQTRLPLLMKDIILSPTQLEAASRVGANAVLLIAALFERGYCECDVHDMIVQARSKNLEVLLEAHTEEEFLSAINTDADLIGINNRDLKTLDVDLEVTKKILQRVDPQERVVVSESGIKTPADIRLLHEWGVQAFLIGSAIMVEDDIEKRVKEFVTAI